MCKNIIDFLINLISETENESEDYYLDKLNKYINNNKVTLEDLRSTNTWINLYYDSLPLSLRNIISKWCSISLNDCYINETETIENRYFIKNIFDKLSEKYLKIDFNFYYNFILLVQLNKDKFISESYSTYRYFPKIQVNSIIKAPDGKYAIKIEAFTIDGEPVSQIIPNIIIKEAI